MNETRATRYQRLRRRASAAALASAAVVLAAIALSPAARGLASLADRYVTGLHGPVHDLAALGIFVILIVILWEAAALPASVYGAWRVQARYARPGAVQDRGAVWAQVRGGLAVALVAVPAAVVAALVVVSTQVVVGDLWWLVAGLLLASLRGAALVAGPSMLRRLADVGDIARPTLAARLNALAQLAGVPVAGIVEWRVDEQAAPALVTGAGSSRHVFVSAAILRDWTDDEIAVVVAHELAHHKYHDLTTALALDAVVMVAALGVAALALPIAATVAGAPGELSALPFVALVSGAVWLAATPLRHAQSRWQERRADVFALSLTGEATAFAAAIRRLGERHLAEERPSLLTRWLYYRHPSVAERLALADAYARARPSP